MSFEEETYLDLEQFVPETMIRPDAKILVVGQSGTGKTVMMLHILHCMSKKLDACFAFCPTRDTREEYLKVLPKCFVGEAYNEEHLEQICEAQRTLHKRKPPKGPDGMPSEISLRRVGIVLDDCAFDKKVFDSKTMRYLMMNSRHENFFFCNGVQYIIDFPKDLRSQIQLVIVFPEPNIQYREPLRKNVLGIFSSDEQLVRTFDEGLREHEALVFDQVAYRAKRQCLFYCKAAFPTPSFLVGSKLFWRMYYRHMVRESIEHIEDHINSTLAAATGVHAAPSSAEGGGSAKGASSSSSSNKRLISKPSEVLHVRRKPGTSDAMQPQQLEGTQAERSTRTATTTKIKDGPLRPDGLGPGAGPGLNPRGSVSGQGRGRGRGCGRGTDHTAGRAPGGRPAVSRAECRTVSAPTPRLPLVLGLQPKGHTPA